MATQYDYYRELVRTRQGVEWNNTLVGGIALSLNTIEGEIAAVRRTTEAALALQQELLNREIMQARLEELIYQTERMVEQFEIEDGSVDSSTRYYLLTGLLETIAGQGISTAIIRGRDNKRAFDLIVERASSLRRRLSGEPEVKKALLWAEEEQRRVAERKRQEDEEIERQRRQRTTGLQGKEDEIRSRIERLNADFEACEAEKLDLKHQIDKYRAGRTPANFAEWYGYKFRFEPGERDAIKVFLHFMMWACYGFIWIPVYWFISKGNLGPADPDINAMLTAQVRDVRRRMTQVDDRIALIRDQGSRLNAELESIRERVSQAG